jgi:CobW/HypB/UreG, nucleotide-binding domain
MSSPRQTWIVLVGGFLAAGKTTLILAAARELSRRGLRCAALFNDQGHDLVDTHYAEGAGLHSGEVTGGCFCCRLSDLVDKIESLRDYAPDVIFAEPVGSCTDLAATVLRPLRELRWEGGWEFRLAPLTILADPETTRELLAENADASMRFLFEKQVQEADLVCFTKSDIYPTHPTLDVPHVRQISAVTGQGLGAWLDEVLTGPIVAGGRPLEIDYEQYAKAEAALVWLNLRAELKLQTPTSPAMFLGPFFDELDSALAKTGSLIAHMKALASGPTGFVKAAIATHGQAPQIEGNLDASPTSELELLLNLRTLGEPGVVRELVKERMREFNNQVRHMELDCFRPGAPVPERRIEL